MIRSRCVLLFYLTLVLTSARSAYAAGPAEAEAAASDPDPYAVALEGGVGIGLFFATHGKAALSIGRRFWDRLDLEAAFRVDFGDDLIGLEGKGRIGLLLHFVDRWDVLLGWRVGYAAFRLNMPGKIIWTEAVAVSVLIEVRYLFTTSLELRLSPVAVTGYWNEIWGFILEPGVGLAYRF